jgi:hypothetical protein
MKIKKRARVIPFGYKSSESEGYLEDIPSELEALTQAKKYLETCSYREVSEWLHRKTGRYISHVGLRKRIQENITTETEENKNTEKQGTEFG